MRDDGHAAVEFGLAAGLLLLPVAVAVLAFGPWSESRVIAEAAAAEAARATVINLDVAAGEGVIDEIAASHDIADEHVRFGWCGSDPGTAMPSAPGCTLARGTQVTLTVELWTPLIRTPWGEVGGVWVSGSHAEHIDLYRSIGET
jgi:Flp pilus assembly protein TadG